jgi:hypothetical protein
MSDSFEELGPPKSYDLPAFEPRSVTLKRWLDTGDITHLLDFNRPEMRDPLQKADYRGMLGALHKRFGIYNVIISEPLDTLGQTDPDTKRAIVDTNRAAAYVATAALEAELATSEVHAVA